MLYDHVRTLDVRVDGYDLNRRVREVSSGSTRTTTVVSLHGDGETGRGEDVTWADEAHEAFHKSSPALPLTGEWSVDEFSAQLAALDLFLGTEPERPSYRNYRRWAFESAALDLGLKQADTNLGERLDREYSPVRFVVSTRLDEPPTGDRVADWLDRDPALEFKLDPTSDWTADLVGRLANTDAVRVLDLKGQYHGTPVDQPADPALYERVVAGFPDALVEDPALTDETRPLFDGHEERVAWDYPIRGVESVRSCPWEPTWLNVKPSRFGSVQSLFDTLDHCERRGIRLYGGGQFELDVGREQLHALASLFYPDGPNDVAPREYNEPEPSEELRSSPLEPPSDPRGLCWG